MLPIKERAKKLVTVAVTSASTTCTKKEIQLAPRLLALDRIPCICYPVEFEKDQNKEVIQALINSGSEGNAMTFAYAANQGFTVQKTNIRAQKIGNLSLGTYGMVFASFQIVENQGRARFF